MNTFLFFFCVPFLLFPIKFAWNALVRLFYRFFFSQSFFLSLFFPLSIQMCIFSNFSFKIQSTHFVKCAAVWFKRFVCYTCYDVLWFCTRKYLIKAIKTDAPNRVRNTSRRLYVCTLLLFLLLLFANIFHFGFNRALQPILLKNSSEVHDVCFRIYCIAVSHLCPANKEKNWF